MYGLERRTEARSCSRDRGRHRHDHRRCFSTEYRRGQFHRTGILSGPGRIAIVCIVVGAWGLVSGFYNYNTKEVALKLVLSTLLVTGGLMWVIPLPH